MVDIKRYSPIFILGNPRSGTSLLRLMLDSHTSISIPPESHFFLWLEEKYGIWENKLLDSYLKDLFQSTKFETWNLNREEVKDFLKTQKIKSYSELNSLIYYFYSLSKNRKVTFWGDKNSLWIEKLPKIQQYYPKAFYIHIIRDGRDIACSYRSLNSRNITSEYAPKLSNDIKEIARSWEYNLTQLGRFLETLETDHVIQIQYEDLIIAPQATLQKILDMIGLKFQKAQTEFYLKQKNDIEPEAFFAWKEKLVQPLDINNIGKFKDELTYEEVAVFNKIAKTTLSKYGYL